MSGSITYLGLAALVLYGMVTVASMAACGTASMLGQTSWNRNVWLALAVLFVVLIFLRGFGIEEMARAMLREAMRSDGSYNERSETQSIIASFILAGAAMAGGWWFYRATRKLRGRRNVAVMAALVAGAAMVFLVALRMISLHMIDKALFGALKLNWIIDIGASFVVLAAALYYVKLVRARP